MKKEIVRTPQKGATPQIPNFQPIEFILAIWAMSCLFFRKFPALATLGLFCFIGFCNAFFMAGLSRSETKYIAIVKEIPTFGELTAPPKDKKEVVIDDRAPMAAPMLPAPGKADPIKYIKKFAPRAKLDFQKYGVPASISLAQGIIESRSGTSKMAVLSNNHFGMKCNSKSHNGCCRKYKDDSNNDSFIDFRDPNQSWDKHAQLVTSGRYAPLKKYGKDYRRWAIGLKSKGYATDKTYAQKLIGVIERYNLHQYD